MVATPTVYVRYLRVWSISLPFYVITGHLALKWELFAYTHTRTHTHTRAHACM